MGITLTLLVVCMVFFVQGKVRADLVALCALIVLVLTKIITVDEAISSFSNSIVIMIIGLFVVSGAVLRTGLAKMASSKIVRLSGTSEKRLFFLVIIVTTLVGAFVSNSGTVALMLPIVMSIAAQAKINVRRILMPLAFTGSIGGMFTLIGTPPNLVIHQVLLNAGYTEITFFSFTPVGCLVFIVGLFGCWILSEIFLSKQVQDDNTDKNVKSFTELAKEYQLSNKRFMLEVSNDSPLIGKTLKELRIPELYSVSLVKITHRKKLLQLRKREVVSELAGPTTVLQLDDHLEALGSQENIDRFVLENKLTMIAHVQENLPDIGVAQAVLLPTSHLINMKIKDSNFRKTYNVNILAVNHRGTYISENLPEMAMQSGDALLVEGTWKSLERLNKDYGNLVLVGQPMEEAAKVTLDHKAPVAAMIMIAMIVAMVIDIVPPVIAVLCAAILMVVTGCLRNMTEAYRLINWESVVLIAAMLPMSVALQKTGAADLVAVTIGKLLGDKGNLALLAGIYFSTSLLTLFISNTATAVLFAPIALQVALTSHASPYPFLMAVTVAASMCFASPFSTPSNVMVMSPGHYAFMDYIKVGLPLQIIMGIVIILALPLIFPF